MSLIKGSVSLTRYRLLEGPLERSDEYITENLGRNRFLDIEDSPEEDACGWVEILDPMQTDFDPPSFNFGRITAFGLRIDTRRVPAKVVAKYLALEEARLEEQTGRPLSADQRRQLKARVRNGLLQRTPVTTDMFEVCWFAEEEEVWLASASAKVRERFEEQWRKTFGGGLIMKIPFVLARELVPADVSADALDQARPSAVYRGE